MFVHDACPHVVLWQALLSAFGRPLGQEPEKKTAKCGAAVSFPQGRGLLRGYDGYVNPYYQVNDYPLTQGTTGSLDPQHIWKYLGEFFSYGCPPPSPLKSLGKKKEEKSDRQTVSPL